MLYEFLGGHKHVRQIKLQNLSKRFQLSNLQDKLLNFWDDIPDTKIYDLGAFRILTTNKYLEGEVKKVQKRVTWKNKTKQVYSCNILPKIPDDTKDEFWRRWVLIGCFNDFLGGNNDPNILAKITTPQEFSGLLNKVILAWRRLEARKHFPDEWNDAEYIKTLWEIDMNAAKLFVTQMCEKGDGKDVDCHIFLEALNRFRIERRAQPISQNACTRALKELGIFIKTVSKKYHPDSSGRAYNKIGLKPDVDVRTLTDKKPSNLDEWMLKSKEEKKEIVKRKENS